MIKLNENTVNFQLTISLEKYQNETMKSLVSDALLDGRRIRYLINLSLEGLQLHNTVYSVAELDSGSVSGAGAKEKNIFGFGYTLGNYPI